MSRLKKERGRENAIDSCEGKSEGVGGLDGESYTRGKEEKVMIAGGKFSQGKKPSWWEGKGRLAEGSRKANVHHKKKGPFFMSR